MPDYEENVSGFKVVGTWQDVVEHGERIAYALEEAGVEDYEDAFEDYNEWRPKISERLDDDVNEKTADKASLDNSGEEPPKENMKQAGEKVAESYKADEQPVGFFKKIGGSLKHTGKAVFDSLKIFLRGTEETVYKGVMTKMSPYYFDNELVSANINKKNTDTYVIEINVNDDDLKEEVSELLSQYDEEYERWHVSTKYDSTSAQEAEGGEKPINSEEDDEENPEPTST